MKSVPLKHLVRINQRALSEATDPAVAFRYVDIGMVGRGELLEEPQIMTFGDAPSRARRLVRPGDTIVSTVRTYLRAAWPVYGSTENLVVSTGFAVLTPGPDIDSRYLGWLTQSDQVVEEVVARSVGVSYPAINARDIGAVRVPVPPLPAQQAIADHLDRETVRIDALIEKKQQLCDLATERLWAGFVAAATDWRFHVCQLRRTFTSVVDGPFGSAFSSSQYVSGGTAVVRLGNIGFAEYRDSDQAFIPLEMHEGFLAHRVHAGDLLIAGLGDANNHAGRACVAPDLGPAIVKGKCFCARVRTEVADPDYLALLMSSSVGRERVGLAARGSTRTMINLEIIKATEIPLPPRSLQMEIVRRTKMAKRRQDELMSAVAMQISVLRERRQALITAAVTGNLEIPGVAA